MEQVNDTWRYTRPDIVCLEGNGARPSHRGDGWSIGGVMYTLNSTEIHGVAYEVHKLGTSSKRLKAEDCPR